MDTEIRDLLKRIAENTEENNVLLKKMHRSMVWSRFFRIAYWLVIIGLAVGAFYFIQPYIDAIVSSVGKVNNTIDQGQDFFGGGLLDIFNRFR